VKDFLKGTWLMHFTRASAPLEETCPVSWKALAFDLLNTRLLTGEIIFLLAGGNGF